MTSVEEQLSRLIEGYELLIEALRWERERWVKLAEEFAARYEEEEVVKLIQAQTQKILEQAVR